MLFIHATAFQERRSCLLYTSILERMRPLHADCCPVQSYVLSTFTKPLLMNFIGVSLQRQQPIIVQTQPHLKRVHWPNTQNLPLTNYLFFNSDKIYYSTYCIVYCKRGKFCIYEVLESVSKALTLFSPFLKWAGVYDSFSRCWHSVKTLFFWHGYLRHLPLTRVAARP